MEHTSHSDSIRRFSFPVWLGWIFTLILSIILIMSNLLKIERNLNWLVWTATGNIILFSMVILFCYFIYRRKQKRTGEIITNKKSIDVPHEDFEKLVTQLIDLRVAFQAITLIATIAITVLSILGYSTIKDAIKESRLAVISDSLKNMNVALDSLKHKNDLLKTQTIIFEQQLNNYKDSIGIHENKFYMIKRNLNDSVSSVERKLTNFSSQLDKNLKKHVTEVKKEVTKGLNNSIENILDKKYKETTIEFPVMKTIPFSVNSPISAHISVINRDSLGKEQECRITFNSPKTVISPIRLQSKSQKIISKRN